ncbi:MAG: class I SAM-dependent methyltransferase [Candidatus Obscuribacterales bacterium]|nr:class I SAM-dependent methyltransferase [Candidatus Obscuribacterales bacterium]
MKMVPQTKEPQYQHALELEQEVGRARLGITTNQMWHDDPRHLLFVLARYKFVAKMLSGKQRVLEVGCGDAFGVRLVQQEVKEIVAVDFDPVFVEDAKERMTERWFFDCREHDMVGGPLAGTFDAAYSVDVIEHIAKSDEHRFVSNIVQALTPEGVLLIGTPSLQSQVYASVGSKEGHVNCMDAKALKGLMLNYFHNVFIFSMNDEVVHTGYTPMAHYLFALCTNKK